MGGQFLLNLLVYLLVLDYSVELKLYELVLKQNKTPQG